MMDLNELDELRMDAYENFCLLFGFFFFFWSRYIPILGSLFGFIVFWKIELWFLGNEKKKL